VIIQPGKTTSMGIFFKISWANFWGQLSLIVGR